MAEASAGAVVDAAPTIPGEAPRLQIVPVRGLPLVAAALIGLVGAIAANQLWALEFFHVVAGAVWTVLDLFLGFVLGPTLARLSVPARAEFTSRFMPKMVLIMPTAVVCTLAAGWQLALHLGNVYPASPDHAWVVASTVVVAVMALIALGVLEPANIAVLFEMRKPRPNGEVIARLMRRFIFTAGITGALQVGTLVIMTHLATP